jgi:hypothetical protein
METKVEEKCSATPITEERLEALGLTQASKNLKVTKEFNRKCLIAYENYRYVREDRINTFNEDLRKRTTEENHKMNVRSFDQLVFKSLETYGEVPPADVLDLLETAKGRNCFDAFEVAKIENMQEPIKRPDPIIFGRITGCPDRFFIGQWDNDVRIEDILKENEG